MLDSVNMSLIILFCKCCRRLRREIIVKCFVCKGTGVPCVGRLLRYSAKVTVLRTFGLFEVTCDGVQLFELALLTLL